MTETLSAKHSGNIGDVWSSIPALRQASLSTGKKIKLYLVNGQYATYYPGAVHPTKNDEGFDVMLNLEMIKMMKPLLLAQSFIESVEVYNDEKIDLNMDAFRDTYVGMPAFSINRWYFYTFPDMACDLTKQWLDVPDSDKDLAKDKVIITRTERYTNPNINYNFLKEFEDDCVFCGTMREYNNFCMNYDLNIRKLHIENFLELAQAIKKSKFHLSNQTQAFQMSEGLRHPRIVELCGFAPNVLVHGENAYDFLGQGAVEYYFHKLNGTLTEYIDKLKSLQ